MKVKPVAGYANQVRIIGGRWRSRRLKFPAVASVRPTPDRVRETLFNWLAPVIEGARCLDLFAGTGALGIEALSRGAAEVVFVESDPVNARALRANLDALGEKNAPIHCTDALPWLAQPGTPFDIVLLDPPFGQDLLTPACAALESNKWLKPRARVYLEAEFGHQPRLPANWEIMRTKKAGQVQYHLAVV